MDQILAIVLTPVLMLVGHGSYSSPFPNMIVENKGDHIELSGISGESGTAICRVTERKKDNTVIVKVHWLLCGVPHPLAPKKLADGVSVNSLNHYKVPISKDIDLVLFGSKHVVIWERKAEEN